MKLALFDFDNTLIQGDSIGHVLKYYFMKYPYKVFYFLHIGVLYLGYSLRLFGFDVVKTQMWQCWYNLSEQQQKECIQKYIEPYYYDSIFKELEDLKKDGYCVLIVSASIEDYLEALQLNVDGIIGTRVQCDGRKIVKVIHNCIGGHKVPLIEAYLKDHSIDYDQSCSVGYSDSKMDYLMLQMVAIRYRVMLKTGIKTDYTFTQEDYLKKKIHQ